MSKGTQSLARGIELLRLVVENDPVGLTFGDLRDRSGLAHATAHRILKRLVEERLVKQDPVTRRYLVGPFAHQIAIGGGIPSRVAQRCRPTLDRLRVATGDTVYLIARSGLYGLCVERLDGAYQLLSFRRRIGESWPLGLGGAGLAILAGMEHEKAMEIVRQNSRAFPNDPRLEETVMGRRISEARQRGRAFSVDYGLQGSAGVGIALPRQGKMPLFSALIAGQTERMPPDRMEFLHEELVAASEELEACLEDCGYIDIYELEGTK